MSAASLLALPIASIAQPRHAAITHAHPQFGIASVYARMLHGRRTASGEHRNVPYVDTDESGEPGQHPPAKSQFGDKQAA